MKTLKLFVTVTAFLLAAPHPAFCADKADKKIEKKEKTDKDSPPGLINNYYRIETIPLPPGLSGQVGGLAFMPDGRLVACFHHGEVYTYETKKKTWNLF